jgi:hypothetical protein
MRPVPFHFVAVASLACLALSACDAPTSFLDAHELSVAAQQVESLAGEAEWLAQQLRERSITANMAWVHQQALGHDAVKVARDIAKPVPPDLRAAHAALSLLDARLQSQVTRIAPAANRPEELEALQGEFRALAVQARPLGERA